MAWFPWVNMPKRSQSPDELIDWLRYSAIEFGAPPQFIDSIEGLGSAELSETAQAEFQELENELANLKIQHAAMRDALISLLEDPADEKRADVAREVLDDK